MGFLDKLLFWKKDESLPDLDLPDLPAPEMPGQAPQPAGPAPFPQRRYPEVQGFDQQLEQPRVEPGPAPMGRDEISLISAKLDTVKAQLDAVLQRLDRMEFGERSYQQRWR